jgi:hypothetical protein
MPQFTGQVNIVHPQSRSYLRILDVPHWHTTGVETTVAQVEAVLWALPMCHLFQLAGPIRPVNNSPSSDMKTVYLKVWDSKAGSAVKELIRRTVQFGKYACHIVKGEAVPGTPLCMRCWCWGHPFKICRAQAVHCPLRNIIALWAHAARRSPKPLHRLPPLLLATHVLIRCAALPVWGPTQLMQRPAPSGSSASRGSGSFFSFSLMSKIYIPVLNCSLARNTNKCRTTT